MKTLFFFLPFLSFGQLHFADTKQSNIGLIIDPYSSYKEKGINIGVEIDYVENGLYIHTGLQNFAVIEGNWTNWNTSIGTVLKVGYFDNFKLYGGGRLGLIFRGGYTYPTLGTEIGLDYWIFKNISIGGRITRDYRSDFEYWDGEAEWRDSFAVKVGFKL